MLDSLGGVSVGALLDATREQECLENHLQKWPPDSFQYDQLRSKAIQVSGGAARL
jgi:hypothetical protein